MIAKERVSVSDGIRWLGDVKPKAFVWYGLFIIELAIASLILSVAYEIYTNDNSIENLDIDLLP